MLKQKNLIHNSTILVSNDIQAFLVSYQFSSLFQQLLFKKNILLTQFSLNISNSKLIVNFDLFFRKKRLLELRQQNTQKNLIFNDIKLKILNILFKEIKKEFNFNIINVNFCILNRILIIPFFFKFLKKKTKFFKKTVFERQIFLYSDFLKITTLYQLGHITIDTFILLFAEIFERLHKGKHGKFIQFIRIFFNLLIKRYKYYSFYRKMLGVKFKISGKIKGKLRAKITTLKCGRVPINSIEKNVEFSKIDVFTVYGTYGFKLWIYQKYTNLQNLNSLKVVKHLKIDKYKKYFFFKKKYYRKNNKYWKFKLKCEKYLKRKHKWLNFLKGKKKKEKKKFLNKLQFERLNKNFLFFFKNKKNIFFSKSKSVQKQSFRIIQKNKISKKILFLLNFLKKKNLNKEILKQQKKLKKKKQNFFSKNFFYKNEKKKN
jgi:hypothetical protein